jgi:hypothetical protein
MTSTYHIQTLSPEYQERYINELQEALKRVNHAINGGSDEWQMISESNKQAARVEKSTREQVPTYRLIGELYNTNVNQVFELLWNLENALKLSGSLEQCELLCQFEPAASSGFETIQILYHGHKSPGFMISQRDFLIARSHKREGNGKMLLSRSVTHANVPDRNKYTRGFLHFSGYVLKPSPTKENTVNICYTIQSDPRGSLPTWVVSMANKTLIDKFVELQTHVDNMNK